MQRSNYELLIEKLDEFIRKYYKNLLLRGALYFTGIFLAFYLSIILLEYVGNFNTTVRSILFYGFIVVNGTVFVRQLCIPALKLYRLGTIISHEEAAAIIGKHFIAVQDRLLNVLQLKQLATLDTDNAALIQAGIDQKIQALKPIPFTAAINLNENRKYLKFIALPLLLLFALLLFNRAIITGSTSRLLAHNTYFEKPAPFAFVLQNENLMAMQQEDFPLDLKIEGSTLPDAVFMEIDGNQYRMDKESPVAFKYLFKNVQKSTSFKFFGAGFYSKTYTLTAIPKPIVLDFEVSLQFPAYLNQKPQQLANTGDLNIPAGTIATWTFHTKNTEVLQMSFGDSLVIPTRQSEDKFVYRKRFLDNDIYTVSTSNQYLKNKDSVQYAVAVIPDQFPVIELEQHEDSSSSKVLVFQGSVSDDHGLSKFAFHYKILRDKDSSSMKSVWLNIDKNSTEQTFYRVWNLTEIGLQAGEGLEYYFEIWDNDGVHGPKSMRSQSMQFKAPTLKQIAESADKTNTEIKKSLKESITEAKNIQKELAELEKKMMEKKSLGWEEKKKAEDLIKRQRDLQKEVEKTERENEKNIQKQSEYKEPDKELAQKHEELRKLMDQLMTEEMKKLMADLEKMLGQQDKEKIQDQLDKMKLENKDLAKELDRTLELFKQMEVEQKLKEATDNLQKLAEKQEQLSKESQDKNADSKELEKKQEELNKQFEDLKKDLKDLEQKNQALEEPKELKNSEEEQTSIDQDMKDSKSNLSQNKKQNASKSQKQAADKMKSMAEKMQQQQEKNEEEQQEEDMDALRALLENLLRLSFDQEGLMEQMKTMSTNNPQYLKSAQLQRKLKDDAKMIEDSLFALSKRVPQIKSVVNREIALVNDNMDKAIDYFQERQISMLRGRGQMAMTSVNNLALMLNEALQQMQQKANEQQSEKQSKSKSKSQCKKPGSACSKPGSGKPSSAAQMKKMQESINQQMDALKKSMQEGKKPGNNQVPGGQPGMSEQLARMAAQQEMLRKELQRYNQENNKDGKGTMGDLDKLAKEMEKTETDLVNKILNNETFKRQQEILTRLLEAEKAEQQRDQEEKRESTEGKNEFTRNPEEFAAYKRLKEKEMELLKTVPPSLSPYYKSKVDDYFKNIKE